MAHTSTGVATEAFVRLMTARLERQDDHDLRELRDALVSLTLAAEIAVERGYIGEDGVDDGLLDAATKIARLVDPAVC